MDADKYALLVDRLTAELMHQDAAEESDRDMWETYVRQIIVPIIEGVLNGH